MATTPEGAILSAICDYLKLRRHFFWRNNSYGIYDTVRQVHRAMPKYSMRGLPDVFLVDGGHLVGIEVKSKTGRQSNDQKVFQRLLEGAGGSYHLVRSVDDLMALGL